MSDPFTTVVTAEPRYNLAVQEGNGLTLSLLGPAGPAGATGAAGAAGPNEITTSTDTALTGYIYGDGTNVAGATAGTPYSTASTLMLRDSDGSTAVEYLNIGTFTGGSPSGSYGTLDAITGSGIDGIELFGTPSVRMASASHTLSLSSSGIALTSGTITTSQPLSLTQTWSTTATYKAIDVNVTDSGPANAASLLMDLRVGGVSKFGVDKSGITRIGGLTMGTLSALDPIIVKAGNAGTFLTKLYGFSQNFFTFGYYGGKTAPGATTSSNGVYAWSNSTTDADTTIDLIVARDAANTLAQRNGTSAQVTRFYDTYTSATDYHRLAIATARATATAMSGATITLTNIIPAGAVVVGVTCKVTTAITGATSFDIGTATDVDRFGAAIATALGTTSDNRNWTAGTIECFPTATSLILTANGSNFTAGAVYVSVQYLSGQAD